MVGTGYVLSLRSWVHIYASVYQTSPFAPHSVLRVGAGSEDKAADINTFSRFLSESFIRRDS